MTALSVPPEALTADEVIVSQAELRLEPIPALVASARAFVVANTASLDADTHETLTLLTSELVTNAVIHARTALEVGVTLTATHVVVTVHDLDLGNSEENPLDREGGRGLMLVRALSHGAGMHRDPAGGKTVWFRLARVATGAGPGSGNLWEEFL